jgi:hypothetical protein
MPSSRRSRSRASSARRFAALHVRALAAVPELVVAGSPPAVVQFTVSPEERSMLMQELRDLENDVEVRAGRDAQEGS